MRHIIARQRAANLTLPEIHIIFSCGSGSEKTFGATSVFFSPFKFLPGASNIFLRASKFIFSAFDFIRGLVNSLDASSARGSAMCGVFVNHRIMANLRSD